MRRRILTVLLITVMLIPGACVPGVSYAADKLVLSPEEEIAIGLYGDNGYSSDSSGGIREKSEKEADARRSAGPVLEADASHYAEALTQEYWAGEGSFELTGESRFYIVTDGPGDKPDKELLDTVRLIDADFAEYGLPGNESLAIVYGKDSRTRDGDIVVELVSEDDFRGALSADKDQAYELSITDGSSDESERGGVYVRASGTDGIYYGLITLLEMAREKQTADKDKIVLDCCEILDGPDYEERTLLLDCGRKYFSKEWIRNLIRRSSLQRYNTLVLHFSEAEGFRLDSDNFPWLTADNKSLSKEDVREIVETAHLYHMDVVPSMDVPGHNRYMVERYAEYVKKHPDFSFTYNGVTYDKKTKGFGSIANHYSNNGETRSSDGIGIDITQDHAVAFVNVLLDEYADFFAELGCTEFDLCGDEIIGWDTFVLGGQTMSYEERWKFIDHWAKYAEKELGIRNGSSSDTFINYLNTVAERLEGKGYTCRVFNDDIDINDNQHIDLKESIDVVYWNAHDNSAAHFAKKGHKVYNGISLWSYYVVRRQDGGDIMDNKYRSVNAWNIFKNWEPESFASKKGRNKTVPEGSHGGGYMCIWCDHPDYKSAAKVFNETNMRTWANASRLWNSEVNSGSSGILARMSYDHMKSFALSMDGFPGYTGKPGDRVELSAPEELESSVSGFSRLVDQIGL